MDRTSAFYSRPSYVGGGGNVFAGSRRQRGGSVFGALKSVVSPILSGVGSSLKKNAISNVVGLAGDVMGDVFRGRNIGKSLINRGKQRGMATLKGTFKDVTGMSKRPGVRKKRKLKRVSGKRQRGSGKRRVARRKPSRKRAASRKNRPSAKRRRRNF